MIPPPFDYVRPATLEHTSRVLAISILAELVQARHGRAAFVAASGPATLVAPAGEEAAGATTLPADEAS
jgi:hypothetical protein